MKILRALLFLLLCSTAAHAQDDDRYQRILDSLRMDSMFKSDGPTLKEFVFATFKTTRVINLETSEVVGRKGLDYRISHRFGDINSGANNAWGIDGPANLFMSLEYSYDGRLMFGLGRSSMDKLSVGFAKYRLFRQTTDKGMPVSVTLFSSIHYTATIDPNKASTGIDRYAYVWDRFSYAHMIIIARKFNSKLSLETAPIMVHYNLVDKSRDKNDMYALGFGGRYKLTQRFALSAEYVLRLNKYSDDFDLYHNEAGVGFDIETGGHVFQIHVTNAIGIDETQFVPFTRTAWKDGGIRIGFNISRVFTIGGDHSTVIK